MILPRVWWLFGFEGWFVNITIIFCILLECQLRFTEMNGKTLFIRRERKNSACRKIYKKLTEEKYLTEKSSLNQQRLKLKFLILFFD